MSKIGVINKQRRSLLGRNESLHMQMLLYQRAISETNDRSHTSLTLKSISNLAFIAISFITPIGNINIMWFESVCIWFISASVLSHSFLCAVRWLRTRFTDFISSRFLLILAIKFKVKLPNNTIRWSHIIKYEMGNIQSTNILSLKYKQTIPED